MGTPLITFNTLVKLIEENASHTCGNVGIDNSGNKEELYIYPSTGSTFNDTEFIAEMNALCDLYPAYLGCRMVYRNGSVQLHIWYSPAYLLD